MLQMAAILNKMAALLNFQEDNRTDLTSSPQGTLVPNFKWTQQGSTKIRRVSIENTEATGSACQIFATVGKTKCAALMCANI